MAVDMTPGPSIRYPPPKQANDAALLQRHAIQFRLTVAYKRSGEAFNTQLLRSNPSILNPKRDNQSFS